MNPVNLGARFLLELTALSGFGIWGWRQRDDGWRFVIALVVPLLAAVLWGVFAVPGDPSRSGLAPVPVSGVLRLALELAFFGLATRALYDAGFRMTAIIVGAAVVLHYLVSYDRLRWLVRQ